MNATDFERSLWVYKNITENLNNFKKKREQVKRE